MYTCVCNAIRETDLRCAARCRSGNAEAIYAAMGHQPMCGQCLDEAEEIVAEEQAAALLPVPRAA